MSEALKRQKAALSQEIASNVELALSSRICNRNLNPEEVSSFLNEILKSVQIIRNLVSSLYLEPNVLNSNNLRAIEAGLLSLSRQSIPLEVFESRGAQIERTDERVVSMIRLESVLENPLMRSGFLEFLAIFVSAIEKIVKELKSVIPASV